MEAVVGGEEEEEASAGELDEKLYAVRSVYLGNDDGDGPPMREEKREDADVVDATLDELVQTRHREGS